MDKEVDDILGEGSDDSDSERKQPEEAEPKAVGAQAGHSLQSAPASERNPAASCGPRGHKRKLNEDAASESSRESSCEDEEGSSSEADEMAAALEAELSDLM